MLKKVTDITSQDLSKGLNTISDIFNVQKEQSPDMMDIKVNFDGSIEKRLGNATSNTVIVGGASLASFNSGPQTVTNNLISYWNLNEVSGQRRDTYGSYDLDSMGTISSSTGKNSNALSLAGAGYLYSTNKTQFRGVSDFSISSWIKIDSLGLQHTIASKRSISSGSNTVLLLHMDGEDASSTFTDSSLTQKEVTVTGAQIDTAQSKFGGASGLFDGSGDYLSIADSPDWDFGTGDFTIDFWMRTPSASTQQVILDRNSSNDISITLQSSGDEISVSLEGVGKSFYPISSSIGSALQNNTWYHIALTRNGTNLRLFINGTQIGDAKTSSENIQGTEPIVIGSTSTGTISFNGWLDEFRIIKGTAAWTSNFSVPTSAYVNPTNASDYEYHLLVNTDNIVTLKASSSGTSEDITLSATSWGALSTSTWYHVVAWHDTANTILGLSVNLATNSASYASGIITGTANFIIGALSDTTQTFRGTIDEVAFFRGVLTTLERKQLYSEGAGNFYSPGASGYTWGGFDFGASNKRWFVVAAGTGLYASSDLGVNFITIGTDRTSNYQSFERSKNILVATSDAYNDNLYWYGSGGTYCAWLNSNSTACKFSINFQGFLILLNSNARKRGFFYEDENTQLTGRWANSFDLPSSSDDEITGAFILRRRLYISTKYRLFRISYVGGNPDWSYVPVMNFGFVPRTVKLITLKDMGEVAIGMTYDRRIRLFDGSETKILSDNVENDNSMCDFAMDKIPLIGSGLTISNAEVDLNSQTYKLCVAIGKDSSLTSHIINFDGRAMSFYPYSNQPWQFMCLAESANTQYIMAGDRSGYIHILDTTNKDVTTPINEHFDSAFMYEKTPSQTSKGKKLDMYFSPTSSNFLYFQDRTDFNGSFKDRHTIKITNTGGVVQNMKTVDIPETFNVYQYRLTSSAGTADPWKLNRVDGFIQPLGIAKYENR